MNSQVDQFLKDFQADERGILSFLELLPVPVMLLREWQILYFNPATGSVFRSPDVAATLIGRNALDLVQDREREFLQYSSEPKQSDRIHRLELKLRTDDLVLDVSLLSRLLVAQGSEYRIVVFEDHTRLSRREKAIFQMVLDTFTLSGDELYRNVVSALAENFQVDAAVIIEYTQSIQGEPIGLMLAGVFEGQQLPINYFELKNSIAGRLLYEKLIVVDNGLMEIEPHNQVVQENQFQSVVAMQFKAGSQELALIVFSRLPIYDTAGITLALNICAVRITSEFLAEEARTSIEKQERDTRLLVEQSADAMFVVNTHGKILLANRKAIELSQYTRSEIDDFYSLISKEHHSFFSNFFTKDFGSLTHSNVALLRKDKSIVYCDFTGVILSDGRIQINARDTTEKRLYEAALRDSEEKYRSIFDNASDAIFFSDWLTGQIIDCNESFLKLTGRSRDEVLQVTHFDMVHESYRERIKKVLVYFNKKRHLEDQPLKFQITVPDHLGNFRPVEIGLSILKRDGVRYVVGIIRDLTASYQAIEEHRKYLQTLSMLKVVVVELDESFLIRFMNNPIANFGSKSRSQMIGSRFIDIVADDFRWFVEVTLTDLLKNRKNTVIRFPCRAADGSTNWYEAEFGIVHDKSSSSKIRGLIKDVTFEYIVEKQTYFMANTDMLTSLPNRNRLEEDLFRAILRADRNQKRLAVGFIDLDRFYDVNDLLGHHLGDLAISRFAEKLVGFSAIARSLYRWGGDQFVFLLENIDDLSQVHSLLHDIKESMREPLTIEEHLLHVACTAGVAIYPDDAQTIDSLFGQADRALQHGKRTGRFKFLLAGDISSGVKMGDRMSLRNRLARAVHHRMIEPFLQPIFDLQENRVMGMEALARLPDEPGLPRIGPDLFIPMAEDLGIIEELSEIIAIGSAETQMQLARAGFDLRLSINLSRRVLYSDDLLNDIRRIGKATGADPKNVCLEITESLAMLDIKNTSERLHELRKLGFKIAIDDFGTGYSTLGQLYEIPVDELKIDKLFVRRIHTHEGQRIAEAIVNMARALNLEIVAEGVEDIETLNLLRNMGVRLIQGYIFSVPLNRKDFVAKLQEGFNVIA